MIKKQVTNHIVYTIDWIEVKEIINSYIKRKYEVTFPKDTQIRVLNHSGVMVEPQEIRFKYKEKENDHYETVKK